MLYRTRYPARTSSESTLGFRRQWPGTAISSQNERFAGPPSWGGYGSSLSSMSLNITCIGSPTCNCRAMIPSGAPLSLVSV